MNKKLRDLWSVEEVKEEEEVENSNKISEDVNAQVDDGEEGGGVGDKQGRSP